MKKIIFKILIILVIGIGAAYPFIPKEQKSVKYSNGNIKYQGDIKNKIPDGKCKYFSESGKLLFDGEWKNGKKDGKGLEYDEYGKLKYDGLWNSDAKSGLGKEFYENEVVKYEGDWKNNKYDGKGKFYYISGNLKYEGDWKNGQRDGKGKEYYNNEKKKVKYEGEFVLNFLKSTKSSFVPNILNMGLVAHDGDYLYYNTLNKEGKYTIVRKNDDTKEIEIVNKEKPGYFINLYKGNIYFLDNDKKLVRSKVDGTEEIELGGIIGNFLTLYGDNIFFVGQDKFIYRANIDGSNITKISNVPVFVGPLYKDLQSGWIYVENEYIFYINNNDKLLYKMKFDGQGVEKVINDKVDTINIVGEKLYYISAMDYQIHVVDLKNTQEKAEKLTKNGVATMIVVENDIYFLTSGKDNKKTLYKMSSDGKNEPEIVTNDSSGVFFNYINGSLYYFNQIKNLVEVKVKVLN